MLLCVFFFFDFFFFQAEDGIRVLVRARGLGDVYKRQVVDCAHGATYHIAPHVFHELGAEVISVGNEPNGTNINDHCGATHPSTLRACLLYTSDAADERSSVDLGGRRIIKKNNKKNTKKKTKTNNKKSTTESKCTRSQL